MKKELFYDKVSSIVAVFCAILLQFKEYLMEKKSGFRGKSYLILFFLLILFWTIIHGQWTVESLLIGSVCAMAILYLNRDLIFTAKEGGPITLSFLFHFVTLIAVLLVEIVKSNIQVAKIVLDPKLPISPCFVEVPVRPRKDFNKVLYGNVVTLTPGTLTVDITNEHYVIHALTKDAAEGLEGSALEEHVLRLEVKE